MNWFSSGMARPTGSMLLAFSDRQAAGFSSSDEEGGELDWNIEDELTEDSGDEAESEEETTDDENEVEVERKSKYTKREALEILKEENGDVNNATHRILKDVMADSLEMLSSQTERKKTLKLKKMKLSLWKLHKKSREKKFRHNNNASCGT